jgi:hypothetical protein
MAMKNDMKKSPLIRLAVLGTSLVAITALTLGACSKDSTEDAATTTTSSSTAAPSTTQEAAATTTPPNSNPPCTEAAVAAAISPNTVNDFVCGNNFAAGSQSNGEFDSAFLLAAGDDNSGQWVVIGIDDETCTNPDIPEDVLDKSPCKVS